MFFWKLAEIFYIRVILELEKGWISDLLIIRNIVVKAVRVT